MLLLKCQICEKNNATIHFTKIINGHVEEKHLCDLCAKDSKDLELNFDFPFSFQKLFTGLMGIKQEEEIKTEEITCECGLTNKRLTEVGRFGCAKCYDTFKDDIEPLIKGIHGHNRHEGKIPKGISEKVLNKKVMKSLQSELKEAISKENFEQAAIIRDEINELKSQIEDLEG